MQGGKHREELVRLRERLDGEAVAVRWSPKFNCFVRFGHSPEFWYEKLEKEANK